MRATSRWRGWRSWGVSAPLPARGGLDQPGWLQVAARWSGGDVRLPAAEGRHHPGERHRERQANKASDRRRPGQDHECLVTTGAEEVGGARRGREDRVDELVAGHGGRDKASDHATTRTRRPTTTTRLVPDPRRGDVPVTRSWSNQITGVGTPRTTARSPAGHRQGGGGEGDQIETSSWSWARTWTAASRAELLVLDKRLAGQHTKVSSTATSTGGGLPGGVRDLELE